jgi:hypothetical protein
VAVALFLLSAGLNTFTVPGCKTSMLDMAPAYSGRATIRGGSSVPAVSWSQYPAVKLGGYSGRESVRGGSSVPVVSWSDHFHSIRL